MPFLRFSRDKRGVENFYLVQATANRRGKVRPRVLYWYRSPPDVKVGREPFDADVRRALEKQNPDVIFDWRAIVETPIPSADADKWRERRRVERAAKHAARAEAAEEASGDEDAAQSDEPVPEEMSVSTAETVEASAADVAGDQGQIPIAAGADGAARKSRSDPGAPASDAPGSSGDPNRNRRRRRRGGRGGNAPANGAPSSSPPSPPSGGEPSGD